MIKKIILLFIFCTYSWFCVSQDLTCDDFKNGRFVGSTPTFPGVEWKIFRSDSSQIEFPSKVPEKYIDMGFPLDTLYARIKRIDDCNYRFYYDESRMKLDSVQKSMNKSGGLFVEKIRIQGRCYYYKSKAIMEGEQMVIDGKICKID